VGLLLAGRLLVGRLLLVGLLLEGQMVLRAVLRRYIFLVRAFLPSVVLSIQMERELFYQYLLRLVDLVDPGLLLNTVLRHRRLRDPWLG
jgi:hypothetical protein